MVCGVSDELSSTRGNDGRARRRSRPFHAAFRQVSRRKASRGADALSRAADFQRKRHGNRRRQLRGDHPRSCDGENHIGRQADGVSARRSGDRRPRRTRCVRRRRTSSRRISRRGASGASARSSISIGRRVAAPAMRTRRSRSAFTLWASSATPTRPPRTLSSQGAPTCSQRSAVNEVGRLAPALVSSRCAHAMASHYRDHKPRSRRALCKGPPLPISKVLLNAPRARRSSPLRALSSDLRSPRAGSAEFAARSLHWRARRLAP
ncbi:hypothetical protein EDE12_11032 [Methylosinus sp. sav-2]|nr:hypothetical protein EDE12_11032 [Methylosinus sp. sav-2]